MRMRRRQTEEKKRESGDIMQDWERKRKRDSLVWDKTSFSHRELWRRSKCMWESLLIVYCHASNFFFFPCWWWSRRKGKRRELITDSWREKTRENPQRISLPFPSPHSFLTSFPPLSSFSPSSTPSNEKVSFSSILSLLKSPSLTLPSYLYVLCLPRET